VSKKQQTNSRALSSNKALVPRTSNPWKRLITSFPIIFIIAVIVAFVAYKFYQSQ
jgi:hypothetical protein